MGFAARGGGLGFGGARSVGVAVDTSVLRRLADYLRKDAHAPQVAFLPIANWYNRGRVRLADQVAAVDFLSRLGQPDIPKQ